MFISKISSVIIVLLVFLGNYQGVVANNLATTAILIILPLMIITILQKKKIAFVKGLWLYIVLVLWTVLSSLLFSEVIYSRKIFAIVVYSMVIILAVLGGISFESFKKWYVRFAIIATVYIVIQAVFAYIFNYFLPAKILPIDLYEPSSFFNTNQYYMKYGLIKLQSVFSEPAQYAQFVIPALCIVLFGENPEKTPNYKHTLLLSLGLILSTSANGILLMGLIWMIYLYEKNRNGFIKILKATFFILITFSIVMQFEIIQSSLSNLFVATSALTSKADYRIYRGISIYQQLPLFSKIFGIGVNNASEYISTYRITTMYDVPWISVIEYFNNIINILIYSGIVGGLLFFSLLFTMYKNINYTGKIILICFVALCFSSSFYFNETWIIYFIIIFCHYKNMSSRSVVVI